MSTDSYDQNWKNPIGVIDARFGIQGDDISNIIDEDTMIKMCKETSKHWSFQLERGENTGLIHYQIRLNLYKKVRKPQLLQLVKEFFGDETRYFHCRPLSKECNKQGKFYEYTEKFQTRLSPPVDDKTYNDRPVMTKQLKQFLTFELRPYQKELKRIIEEHKERPDFRSIYFIQDTTGGIGKSIFAEYLEYNKLCEELPLMTSMEDISSWIASSLLDANGNKISEASDCYLIDIPRSKDETKIGHFLAGIEQIKDGKCFDKRYRARKIRFNRPMIMCFCNSFPSSFQGLTLNRWKCYTINKEYELQRYEKCPSYQVEQNQNELTMIEDEQEVQSIENEICEYTPDKLDKLV